MRKLVVVVAAVMLASCATQYGDMGYTGGVRADQMTANQYRIVSRGNGFSDSTQVADFAIRKAAEVTLESGNEWFLVMGRDDQTDISQSITQSPSQTYGTATAYGNSATYNATTYGGGLNIQSVVKPGQDLMIRVGKGPRPEAAYDAAETLHYVVARTERTNTTGTAARRALLGF